jgi:hypothetical protein
MDSSKTLSILVFAALVISIFADIILRAAWNKMYFTVGIPIFVRNILIGKKYKGVPHIYLLEEKLQPDWLVPFAFEKISSNTYAFREKYFQFGVLRYIAVMHGLLIFDGVNRQVKVRGLANWFWLWLPLYYFMVKVNLVQTYRINFSDPVAIILLVVVALYLIQCWRYSKVIRIAAEMCSTKEFLNREGA